MMLLMKMDTKISFISGYSNLCIGIEDSDKVDAVTIGHRAS